MTERTPAAITDALRRAIEHEASRGDPQASLARIARFMGVIGISQCAGDVADEAIKRLDDQAVHGTAQFRRGWRAGIEAATHRLADSWTWDDEDFLSCVIADLKRLEPTDTDMERNQ